MIINYLLKNPNSVPILTDELLNEKGKPIPGTVKVKDAIMLLPGYNDIPTEKWNGAKKNLSEYHLNNCKIIESVEKNVPDAKTGLLTNQVIENPSFFDLNVNQKMTVIEGCLKIKDLEAWLKKEESAEVRYAINERLTAIKEGRKNKTEDRR